MKRTRESHYLTRRESEIMDVLYKLEEATVADVREELSGKRNHSTVRAHLRRKCTEPRLSSAHDSLPSSKQPPAATPTKGAGYLVENKALL